MKLLLGSLFNNYDLDQLGNSFLLLGLDWISSLWHVWNVQCETRLPGVVLEFDGMHDLYNDFEDGWWGTASKKDVSDIEWQNLLIFLKQSFPWLILHVTMSELIRNSVLWILPYWHCAIGATFLVNSTGLIGLILVVLQPLCFHCTAKLNKKYLVWICCSVFLFFIIRFKWFSVSDDQNLLKYSPMQYYMLVLVLSWINLRCLSFSLDHLNRKYNLIIFFSYCLYLPTLILGPFITFDELKRTYVTNSDGLQKRAVALFIGFVRYGFWIFFVELFLHLFYVNALSYQIELVKRLSNSALYGYGYSMGQFFHLKYVVFYGLSTTIAKFECIKAPSTPKCIGRIHLYSDMWKYFDAGLYKFLLNYIYLPTAGDFSLHRQLFSSFLCFSFVYIWHGIENHILVWASVNYLGICVEKLIKVLASSKYIRHIEGQWKHRLLCCIYSPLLCISAISNFYFFAGTTIGNIFVERIFYSNASSNLVLLFSLYCCCHVSMHVKKWEKQKTKD